jgi:DNA topoisomerase III
MKIVIAEKPSVARDLAKVLGAIQKKDGYLEGNGYQVTWALGHLVQLADPKAYGFEIWDARDLPMLPSPFQYRVSADAGIRKQFNIIKGLFSDASEILVATDAGREGELIFRYIYYLSGCNKPFKRLWISSQTDQAIRDGFNNLKPGTQYDNLYYAARGRSEADWLVGMNATRSLTLSAQSKGVLSLGRVQTPILAMICSRYVEHTNFKPEPFWELWIGLEKEAKPFKAKHPPVFKSQAEADLAKAKVTAQAQCTKAETKKAIEQAPLLFDLTSLQQETNQRFGFSAQQTLDLAQDLYEKQKVITYPRTGSRYLSDDLYAKIPALMRTVSNLSSFQPISSGLMALPISKRPFNAAKVTDHHAILPTETNPATSGLAGDHYKLYQLIVTRFLAAFSPPCEKEVTQLEFVSGGLLFKASGSLIMVPGWRAVESEPAKQEEEEDNEQKLPKVVQGDILPVGAKQVVKKMTQPKPIHTEASLLKLMETAGKDLEDESLREALKEGGIGTPATRANIIETLFKREYIQREKKKIVPTPTGLEVYELVKDQPIASAEMTGKWERELNRIALGKGDYPAFMENIRAYARQITQDLLQMGNTLQKRLPVCPKCKGDTLKESAKAISCSTPACGLILWKSVSEKALPAAAVASLLKGQVTAPIKGFKSKAGTAFEATLGWSPEWKVAFQFAQPVASAFACPICKRGELTEGEKFFKCGKEGCSFILWKEVAGKKMTAKICKTLLEGKETEKLDGFLSKANKPFKAKLKLTPEGKVAFVFPAVAKPSSV